MKTAAVLLAGFILSIGAFTATADPLHREEKAWQYGAIVPRAVIPEQEPNDACPGQPMEIGDAIDPARIDIPADNDWYSFNVGTVPQSVSIMTDASPSCDPDAGDTYIYLMAPDCATQLAADDDGGPGLYSFIANYIITEPGTYHVRVRHYSSSGTGCYMLYLMLPPPPPPNDRCYLADPIERCASGRIVADLNGAFNDYDPAIPGPSCTGFSAAGKDLTYVMNLAAGDSLSLAYTGDAFDASFYVVTDCDRVSETCLIGADASYNVEVIEWGVPATGTYYLICDAYGTNTGGAFVLDYEIICPVTLGACCIGDQGECRFLTRSECDALQGIYQGDGIPCEPENPCQGVPTEARTWGRIRQDYR